MTHTMTWVREGLLIKSPNSGERLLNITELAFWDIPYGGNLDERSSGYIVTRREFIEQQITKEKK